MKAFYKAFYAARDVCEFLNKHGLTRDDVHITALSDKGRNKHIVYYWAEEELPLEGIDAA